MSDLVERLRAGDYRDRPLEEAADEIERLTRELEEAREALRDFRDYILKFDGDAVLVGGAHHNPIWPRIAEQIARLDAEEPKPHPDDIAVDQFARAMSAKLAAKRNAGRGGWEDPALCSAEFLSALLREHVEKGDPLDVGNLAMMLHQRGERIARLDAEEPKP